MERTKRDKKSDVDRIKPLNIEELSKATDCFGSMWDPTHRSCSVCADVDICGVVYQETQVLPKKAKFDKEKPLDTASFDKVNWDKLTKLVSKYQEDGDPLSYEELLQLITDMSNFKDDYTVKVFIEKGLHDNDLVCNDDGSITKK